MKTISDYLDALRDSQNLNSDGKISRYLGVTKQAVSRYRHNAGAPDNDVCWRISEGTGIDYSEIVAVAELTRAERAHDTTRAHIWTQRLRQISAACLLLFAGFFHAGDVSAAPAPAAEGQSNVYYVKYAT